MIHLFAWDAHDRHGLALALEETAQAAEKCADAMRNTSDHIRRALLLQLTPPTAVVRAYVARARKIHEAAMKAQAENRA